MKPPEGPKNIKPKVLNFREALKKREEEETQKTRELEQMFAKPSNGTFASRINEYLDYKKNQEESRAAGILESVKQEIAEIYNSLSEVASVRQDLWDQWYGLNIELAKLIEFNEDHLPDDFVDEVLGMITDQTDQDMFTPFYDSPQTPDNNVPSHESEGDKSPNQVDDGNNPNVVIPFAPKNPNNPKDQK